jgi:hypothetical protein
VKFGGGAATTVSDIVVEFDNVPDVPEMDTLPVPVVAVPPAVSVRVLMPVAGFGLKDAVTPLGRPDAEKFTLPVKPFCGATEIVVPPLVPCMMDRLLGFAERVKFGGGTKALIVRMSVVGIERLPDVPVIVMPVLPTVAVELAVSFSVLVAVAGFGVNEAVTPLGRPDAEKLTLPLKPFWGAIVSVLVPLLPCTMAKLLGDTESEKFAGGATALTVRESVVELDRLPDVPVSVTVAVPVDAVPLVVSINVLALVAGFGLKEAVTPVGKPDTENVTLPLKLFCGDIVSVLVPLAPWTIVRLLGDAESEKLGAGAVEPGPGQLFTRFAALTLPMPVAKSHPIVAA